MVVEPRLASCAHHLHNARRCRSAHAWLPGTRRSAGPPVGRPRHASSRQPAPLPTPPLRCPQVVKADIKAGKAVVHKINRVLVPGKKVWWPKAKVIT